MGICTDGPIGTHAGDRLFSATIQQIMVELYFFVELHSNFHPDRILLADMTNA
jgi:hypothetical protein